MKNGGIFFKRIFIFYLTFTLLIVLLLSQIIYFFTQNLLKDQILKNNEYLLGQAQIYTEEKILTDIYDIINNNFIYTYSTPIGSFFVEDTDINSYLNIFTDMKRITDTRDYFTNIGLYNRSKDHYISVQNGVILYPEKDPMRISDFNFSAMVELQEGLDYRSKFFSNEEGLVSFIQPLPLYKKDSEDFMILSFNPNAYSVTSAMDELLSNSDSTLYILDNGNRLLMNYSLDSHITNDITSIIEKLDMTTSTQNNYHLKDHNTYITWIESPVTGWTYILQIPYAKVASQIKTLQLLIIGIILLFMLIVYGGIVLITKRIYRPITNLVLHAKGYADQMPDKDEFKFICGTLDSLESDVQQEVLKNKTLIEYRALMDFFFGSIGEEEFASRLTSIDKALDHRYFSLFVLTLDKSTFKDMDYLSIELEIQNMKQQVLNGLRDYSQVLYFNNPQENLIFLINHDYHTDDQEILYKQLTASISDCQTNYTGVLSNISTLDLLRKTCINCCRLLQYQFVLEQNNIFSVNELGQIEERIWSTSPRLEEFKQHLGHFEFQTLHEKLIKYEASILAQGYEIKSIRSYFHEVAKLIVRFSTKQDIQPHKGQKSLHHRIRETSHITELIRLLHEELTRIEDATIQRQTTVDNEFLLKITHYIDTHVNEDLSLASVATHFNQSQSHLSKVFKKEFDIKISTYIIDRKLDKAADLLVAAPQREINDIAESLGYYTPSYFSRIFKQKFGLTPAKYRKEKKSIEQ